MNRKTVNRSGEKSGQCRRAVRNGVSEKWGQCLFAQRRNGVSACLRSDSLGGEIHSVRGA